MSIPVDSNLDLQSSAKVINVPTPTSSGDAVNKAYADAISAGVNYKEAVVAASTGSNVSLTAPGATLDGVSLAAGNRILLKDQTTTSQNGLWVWSASASALARPTDYAAASATDAEQGDTVYTLGGTANGGTSFTLITTGAITIDTTSTSWTASANGAITAGTGLTRSGTTISIENSGELLVTHGGTGAATASGARTNLGAPGKYSTTVGDGTTATFTVTHSLATTAPIVQVFDVATGNQEFVQVAIVNSNSVTVGPFTSAPAATSGVMPGGTGKQITVIG